MVFFDSDGPTIPRDWPRNYSLSTPLQNKKKNNNNSRRSLTTTGEETCSYGLMNCFDTPPKRTIFGTKNSEHWNSFQNKYCSRPSNNNDRQLQHRQHHHEGTIEWRRTTERRRNNKTRRLFRILFGCWFPRRPLSRCNTSTSATPPPIRSSSSRHGSDFHGYSADDEEEDGNDNDCDHEDETIPWRKKNIPLVERYSEYFERRTYR